jgi:hypothetical protein
MDLPAFDVATLKLGHRKKHCSHIFTSPLLIKVRKCSQDNVTVEQRQAARLANMLSLVSGIQRQTALTSFVGNAILK